jgi:hypothetical protein
MMGLSRSTPSSAAAESGRKKRTRFKSPTPLNYTRPQQQHNPPTTNGVYVCVCACVCEFANARLCKSLRLG